MKFPKLLLVTSCITVAVAITCSSNSVESEETETEEKVPNQEHFMNAFEMNEVLGRGINLGNALEAPEEGEWGMVIEEEFIQLIKDAGFESVRIPIRWNAHAAWNEPYKIHDSFFERVDEVIGWSLDRGLAVMINIHHYDELMETPHAHRNRLSGIWKQIASRYKEYPEEVVFEVLNEPHDNLNPDLWNVYLSEVTEEIRGTNTHRVIVAGTANWGGFHGLQDLELPDDDQIIVTIHNYNPFHFTHQGAGWAGPDSEDWLGTTWSGTEEEKNELDEEFDTAKEWADEHGRPLHLGEFGAFERADDESRELWTTYIREAAELRDFSWAYWEFGSGFGVYDRNAQQWRDYLLRALIPSPELDSNQGD
ncbi:MAG: glycoside hydrolase family 5 protein [Balneolaceae bacterium]